MLAGNDSVTLGSTAAVRLAGNLSVQGGDGVNGLNSSNLSVGGSVTVTNGTNATRQDFVQLGILKVGGKVMISNGDGDSYTAVSGNAAGTAFVAGNVSVTNGTGVDRTQLNDIDVGGNVLMSNGHGGPGVAGAPGSAGSAEVYNVANVTRRSVIRGSVKLSYLDGDMTQYNAFWDLEVLGNLTVNHGTGAFVTNFNGFRINEPIVVRGNVTLSGTGANQFDIGTAHNLPVGLVVGKNLTVTTGAAADTVGLEKVVVGGTTTLSLGAGANTVQIDDAQFVGVFRLTTGSDTDAVRIDTRAGSAGVTTFERSARISLGEGTDSFVLAGRDDAKQGVVFLGSLVVHHGTEGESATLFGKDVYPFGGGLQWLV